MLVRRAVRTLVLALFVCVPAASPAAAQEFKGSTAYWADLTATVQDGRIVAFKTRTGRLQSCQGHSGGDPQDIQITGPVAIVDGKFHLEGVTKDGWGDPFTWSADGTVSLDGRDLTGTLRTSGVTTFGDRCEGEWPFEAIIAPSQARPPLKPTFRGTLVSFNYKAGVITNLTAQVGTTCPGGSVLGARLLTSASGIDPIRVDKGGRFRVAGGVIDDYGVVTRYVLTGRVTGRRAVGTVESYRYSDTNGKIDKCTRNDLWRAAMETAPKVNRAPQAFYLVAPFRWGSPGAFSYYLIVKMSGCARANRVRVSIAGGPTSTTGCRGQVRLGPLTPKRRYRVRVTALKTRGARVLRRSPTVTSEVYLPGDDGNWIEI